MFTLTSRKMSRAAIVAALTLAGSAGAFLAASVDPAMALCKYGTPHCAKDPNPPNFRRSGAPKFRLADGKIPIANITATATPARTTGVIRPRVRDHQERNQDISESLAFRWVCPQVGHDGECRASS